MTKEKISGYSLFLIGLMIASMGVALSTKAGLGTSPVASVPYSVSLAFGLFSFGTWLNIWSLLQILVEILIRKGRCKWDEIIIQTVLAFAYGYMTNFSCYLIRNLGVNGYGTQLLLLALSLVVLAFGLWLQFKGGVAMLPGEAMNRAISEVTGKKYENVKILFDIIYIVVASVICGVFIGKLAGVREGSIVAALGVGLIIKFYNNLYHRITGK